MHPFWLAIACREEVDVPGGTSPPSIPGSTTSPSTSTAPPEAPPPTLEAVDAVTLPLPTANGLPPVRGFVVNARIHPHGLPTTWRVEYGETPSYGATTPERALPGQLTAHFEEAWDGGTHGWTAGMSGVQLAHFADGGPAGGPFVRYTDDQSYGNDVNHFDGIGLIHLGPYAYLGNYTWAEVPPMYLGGGFPDLRGAQFTADLRGVDWVAKGTELGTWIQGYRDPSVVDLVPEDLRYPNWAHTGELQTDHLLSGDWEAAEWTLDDRSLDWTFAGSYGGRMTYDYGELDALLSKVNVDLFALQVLYVDFFDQPSGAWDLANLTITYRQHSVLAPSNGGALATAATGADRLTDGWRNGPGHEWTSEPNPAGPQVFEYTLAAPVTLETLNVHNAVERGAREVRVEVSADAGASWATVLEGELPEAHELGPNYLYLHADRWIEVDGIAYWAPLHPDPVDRLRLTILSGWHDDVWALGEIEAFGSGATERTDDNWYDLTRDIRVDTPGEWHYRVIATSDGGEEVGPDQVVRVP